MLACFHPFYLEFNSNSGHKLILLQTQNLQSSSSPLRAIMFNQGNQGRTGYKNSIPEETFPDKEHFHIDYRIDNQLFFRNHNHGILSKIYR